MFLELPKWHESMWLGWLLLSAPRWRHLATCGDNRDNREHLTLALELPTLASQALARLNCPGENKGWENISSFKYSWLAPSRPARLHYSARHPNSHITAAGHCRGTARCFSPSWVRATAGQRHTLDAENDANPQTHFNRQNIIRVTISFRCQRWRTLRQKCV